MRTSCLSFLLQELTPGYCLSYIRHPGSHEPRHEGGWRTEAEELVKSDQFRLSLTAVIKGEVGRGDLLSTPLNR